MVGLVGWAFHWVGQIPTYNPTALKYPLPLPLLVGFRRAPTNLPLHLQIAQRKQVLAEQVMEEKEMRLISRIAFSIRFKRDRSDINDRDLGREIFSIFQKG